MYLDIFINKYANKYANSAGSHLDIIDALQIEAIDIFKNLINYCKSDVKYIIDNIKGIVYDDCTNEGSFSGSTHKLLERKHIMDYIKFNSISL